MCIPLEIKSGTGLSAILFGASMEDAEKVFGKTQEAQLIDDIEEFPATVWHYLTMGFTLFFDELNNQLFNSVEIGNFDTVLWKQKIFDLKDKQNIKLFKSKGIKLYETEQHDWGENPLSFGEVNIDFYFKKNKLISINYGSLTILKTG